MTTPLSVSRQGQKSEKDWIFQLWLIASTFQIPFAAWMDWTYSNRAFYTLKFWFVRPVFAFQSHVVWKWARRVVGCLGWIASCPIWSCSCWRGRVVNPAAASSRWCPGHWDWWTKVEEVHCNRTFSSRDAWKYAPLSDSRHSPRNEPPQLHSDWKWSYFVWILLEYRGKSQRFLRTTWGE